MSALVCISGFLTASSDVYTRILSYKTAQQDCIRDINSFITVYITELVLRNFFDIRFCSKDARVIDQVEINVSGNTGNPTGFAILEDERIGVDELFR